MYCVCPGDPSEGRTFKNSSLLSAWIFGVSLDVSGGGDQPDRADHPDHGSVRVDHSGE